MRTVKEINVDIKRLKAELKEAFAREREVKALRAIAYVEKQGYKWDGRCWVKPTVAGDKPLDKPRQFVVHNGKIYLIIESFGTKVTARQVINTNPQGFILSPHVVSLWTMGLRYVDETYVRTMFA